MSYVVDPSASSLLVPFGVWAGEDFDEQRRRALQPTVTVNTSLVPAVVRNLASPLRSQGAIGGTCTHAAGHLGQGLALYRNNLWPPQRRRPPTGASYHTGRGVSPLQVHGPPPFSPTQASPLHSSSTRPLRLWLRCASQSATSCSRAVQALGSAHQPWEWAPGLALTLRVWPGSRGWLPCAKYIDKLCSHVTLVLLWAVQSR